MICIYIRSSSVMLNLNVLVYFWSIVCDNHLIVVVFFWFFVRAHHLLSARLGLLRILLFSFYCLVVNLLWLLFLAEFPDEERCACKDNDYSEYNRDDCEVTGSSR